MQNYFQGEGHYRFRAVGLNPKGEVQAELSMYIQINCKDDYNFRRKFFLSNFLSYGWKDVRLTHVHFTSSYDQ